MSYNLYQFRSRREKHLPTGTVASVHLGLSILIALFPVGAPLTFGWQGSGTKIFAASAQFLADDKKKIDPEGDFGGPPDISLRPRETEYICALQKALPNDTADSFIEWYAASIATLMKRETLMILPILKDPSFCAKRPLTSPQKKAPLVVHVNPQGIVVSLNKVWNACISGTGLTMGLIRSNTNSYVHRQGSHRKNIMMTCRDYHRGDIRLWRHPDFPDLELRLDAQGRLLGGVPTGYIIKKDGKETIVKKR